MKHKPLNLNLAFKITNLAESERNSMSKNTFYTGKQHYSLDLLSELMGLRNEIIKKVNRKLAVRQ
jgi:hypothetical protein